MIFSPEYGLGIDMFQPANLASTPEAPTTYMTLTAVLAFLVFLTLWREMSSGNGSRFFTRSSSALSFVGSRLVAVIFSSAMIAGSGGPPVLFMLLNFLCLYLAASCLPETDRNREDEKDEDSDTASPPPAAALVSFNTLRIQIVLWGVVGLAAYVAVPRPFSLGYSVTTLATAFLLGSTLRIVIYLFRFIRTSKPALRMPLFALVSFVAASWLLVVSAGVLQGSIAVVLLQAARAADILALISGLLSMQSNYLILGFYHKNRADTVQVEAEKAKAELTLLSRVASDIYEDSNSMIQRQQDHSRDLMRRIENLEKILQIGITIQKRKNLKELLQMIAKLIEENLGFNTVILRLLNERTQSFETKAHVGLSEEAEDAVVNYRLPMSEYERMADPRFRISRSYYVKRASLWDENGDHTDEAAVVTDNQWAEIDRLVIPLVDEKDTTLGYISVEDPVNMNASVVDAIDNLETVATLVVIAIRNARYVRAIAEKNEKLKLYAEKLSGLNKMKANFVATISHEFRTPLTSIKAYCETLLKNADNVDRNILKEFLVVIDEESDRLMTLIEDILDFSQMESGAIKFERTPCNMNEIVAVATKELEKNFERKNIKLHQNLTDTDVMIRAERDLIRQLLINLLHNASKFTQENGEVWIRLKEETVSARITVEDNGIGIPADQMEMIFDHFHQADNSSTREFGGSGLGLAICKNIVDWHDGKIWVENAPGRGTKFVVVLPKKQAIVRSHVLSHSGTMRRYEIDRYLELLVEMITELMNVKKASIMLADRESGELRIESAIGMDEEIVENARVRLGEGIAGKVALERRSYLVEDIDRDTRVNAKNNDFLYNSRSFLSVPITIEDEVVGVINVADPEAKLSFDQMDKQLLEVFSVRVGLALQTLDGFTGSSHSFEQVRTALRSMLDAKRYVNDQGMSAMRKVLVEVARQLGFTSEDTATLLYVFNVYDMGLAGAGYNMVKQPGQLSVEDRKSVERHTIIGTEMLESLESAPNVRDAVLYHHENFDGTGYPGKLAGEEIPLLARIIRVADSFRALVSSRPYQKTYTIREAIEVLKHRGGSFFDPKITSVFVEVLLKHETEFSREKSTRPGAGPVDSVSSLVDASNFQGGN
jgi:signal transduction histidine kinase/HD-GYP domain-containing protein (c-di-GMP phosphodiesterase class II)